MSRTSLLAILFLLSTLNEVSAVRFDILGLTYPLHDWGDKSVLASDDGNAVVVTASGGNREAFLWRLSQGITQTFPQHQSSEWFEPLGISGDGHVLVGLQRNRAGIIESKVTYDASFDGTVSVGIRSFMAFRSVEGGPTTDLGSLPGGDSSSRAVAVSADGSTVVGNSSGAVGHIQPFRWTVDEGMQPLDLLPVTRFLAAKAHDVSGDGSVVVGEISSAGGTEAFRWTPTTGMQGLGDLPGGHFISGALGVSADGQTIVGFSSVISGSYGRRAFIWNARYGMRDLGRLLESAYNLDLQGVTLHTAMATSADGRVIVGTGTKAFGTNIDTVAWRAVIPEPATIILAVLAIPLFATARRNRIAQSP